MLDNVTHDCLGAYFVPVLLPPTTKKNVINTMVLNHAGLDPLASMGLKAYETKNNQDIIVILNLLVFLLGLGLVVTIDWAVVSRSGSITRPS